VVIAFAPLGVALFLKSRPPVIEFLGEKKYGGHSDATHILALGQDELVEYGPHEMLQAYGLDGKLRWEFIPPHPPGILTGAALHDSHLYVGTNSNYLYALDGTGKIMWSRQLDVERGWGLNPILSGGDLLVFTPSRSAYLVSIDGTVKWYKKPDELAKAGVSRDMASNAEYAFQHISMVGVAKQFTSSAGIRYSLTPGDDGLVVKSASGSTTLGTFFGGNGLSAFTEDTNGWVWHLSCGMSQPDPWLKYIGNVVRNLHAYKRNRDAAELMLFDPQGHLRGLTAVDSMSVYPPVALPDGSIILPEWSYRLKCYRVRKDLLTDNSN